jgi:hypothetical protein
MSTTDPKVTALSGVMAAIKPLTSEQCRDVLKTAAEWSGVEAPPAGLKPPATGQSSGTPVSGGVAGTHIDLKSTSPKDFLKAKQPKTDVQRVVCLGYILTNIKGQTKFKTADLTSINEEARGDSFSNLAVSLANATKQNRYFSSVKGGFKQLTATGEQAVEALPNQELVKEVGKVPRKKRKKNSTSKGSGKSKP